MPQAQQPTITDLTRRELPLQLREAQVVPSSYRDGTGDSGPTIEVVWTTGARRRAYDWYADTAYEEELVVEDGAVDMSRFDAGAVQVLDNHRMYGGVAAILGIAVRGWIKDGQGLAEIRLSQRPELAGIVQDIRAGIIRTISFGYAVQRYEITRAQDRTDGVNLPLYRAVQWTPQEISFVTVPADPNAGTRSQQQQPPGLQAPCEFVTRIAHGGRTAATPTPGESMDPTQAAGGAPAGNEPAVQRSAAVQTAPAAAQQQQSDAERAALAERERSASITELCTRHGVTHLAQRLITDGRTVDQARSEILEELARRDAASGGHRNVSGSVQTVRDEHQTRIQGIQEAILHRVLPRAELTDNGRQYRGLSLLEMGREVLEARGVVTRSMSRMELATQMLHFRSGMHTTSDFANLFANVANKRLRMAYDENPGSYSRWARRAPNAPDFKSMKVVQLSGAPTLLRTNEHGEFKYGAMSDGGESYNLLTYGRIVSLTRQAIVNDDLRGFDRLVGAFGNSARRLENATVYSQLTDNGTMADTGALFNATAVTTTGGHANYASGGGSALAISALTTARTAMRKQVGLQSEVLNITPAYLIVPAALEQTAYQFTSNQYVPATKTEINEFRTGGRTALEPIVEPILDSVSATAWYLAADASQIDTIEYCYLDGEDGPVIESEIGFEVDGVSYKCRLDFAAKAVDYRGLYKAAGA